MLKLILLNIAFFQGVVIGFILLHSPFFKSKANQYLAFALFSLSWSLLNLIIEITQAIEKYTFLKVVDIVDSAVLFPVLVLLFIIHQINHSQKKHKNLGRLFLPILFALVISFLQEVLSTKSTDVTSIIISLLEIVNFIIHLFFIPFVLVKTYKIIQYSKSKEEKKWLTYLWSYEVCFLGTWLLAILISPFVEYEIENVMYGIALFVTLLIHWVAYFGVYKLKLANDQQEIKKILFSRREQVKSNKIRSSSPLIVEIKAEKNLEPVIKQSKIPTKENTYYVKLEQLCIEKKIFRDSNLDRNKVSDELGISPSYVSQLTNSITGENFSTYINRYRVEEVKKLILDKEFDNYSLLAIGLECGFSSKTTYYNWFKKITGMTPNTFRKTHQ